MSETGILALAVPLLAALIAAVSYLWKARDKVYEREIERRDAEIDKRDKEIAAGRLREDALRDAYLKTLQTQLDDARRQVTANVRVADALQATSGKGA